MLQGEHSAILSTFIKLPFVIKIFVLSVFEWPFYTGFTILSFYRYKNTIQYFIVCGIGVVGIFRTTLDFIFNKLYGKIEGKIKASVGVIESFQQLLLLVMCILLRTHNTIYVAGLAVVERLTEDLVPSIISLPVPYLTMFCLWMGRASFFYQVCFKVQPLTSVQA